LLSNVKTVTVPAAQSPVKQETPKANQK
jgi:hypothetical protein